MPLSAGAKFGPYQIRAPLGAGGMGEVYRARDTRLDRDVALKILSESAAGNADRRARFEREARALAALNHPNIVSIYDVGSEDGVFFIVSELVEGESLRQRIRRGHLAVRELLKIAVQLADGMAAAHSLGIVHRDLKPENIMLAADGRVKILDFGLARQTVAAATESTVTLNQTVPGTVLGTVNYMSPEQARGAEAGYPSDQFSFGVILYEMATGNQAFRRDTTPQTLTAILMEEPTPIEAKLPTPLRWTIDRCLAKEPKARYESTRDLFQDLRNQQEHFSDLFSASVETAPAAPKTRKLRSWMYWAVPVACLLAGVVAGALLLAPKRHGIENYRYTPIEISQEMPVYPTWAPDGKAFSYSALVDGRWQSFVRYANSSAASQITHAADGTGAIGWSPDSRRVFIAGKNPQGDKPPYTLFSLSVTGGEPEFVMPLDIVTGSISQDGRVLAVIRKEEDGTYSVATSSPVGSPLKRYSPAPFGCKNYNNVPHLKLSPDGSHILYFLNPDGQEQAWSIPFPAGNGTPKLILKDLPHYGGSPEFSWFPDSLHIAISLQQHQGFDSHLWIADTVSSSRTPLTTGLFSEDLPAVSPNGKQVLFVESTNDYKLVSASLADASIRKLISSQRPVGMPAWARKSDRFAYQTDRTGEPEIWLHDGDGSERPLVTPAMFPSGTTNWWMNPTLSPDGDRLAYTRSTTNGEHGIWISSLAGGPPVRLTNTSELEYMASWSPDGGRIAYYQSAKGGTKSIMICKTSGQATPMELRSKVSDNLPDWSPTGEWISFADDSGWNLISPDGKSTRALGKIATPHLTFSKDGQTLYGIRAEKNHQYLFSLSLTGDQMKTIGDVGTEFVPSSYLDPGIRFSLSPDGKSILYPSLSIKTSLWMLEGFDAP
jgi:serine/threonine protein kinase